MSPGFVTPTTGCRSIFALFSEAACATSIPHGPCASGCASERRQSFSSPFLGISLVILPGYGDIRESPDIEEAGFRANGRRDTRGQFPERDIEPPDAPDRGCRRRFSLPVQGRPARRLPHPSLRGAFQWRPGGRAGRASRTCFPCFRTRRARWGSATTPRFQAAWFPERSRSPFDLHILAAARMRRSATVRDRIVGGVEGKVRQIGGLVFESRSFFLRDEERGMIPVVVLWGQTGCSCQDKRIRGHSLASPECGAFSNGNPREENSCRFAPIRPVRVCLFFFRHASVCTRWTGCW